MKDFFCVHHRSKRSKARLGKIHTDHGVIQTPSFVPVATKGTLKALSPEYVRDIGIQTAFVNTYHLVVHPGVDIIEKAGGGIHAFSRLDIPLMSDSGGFQVFSLKHAALKKAHVRGEQEPLVINISDDGVLFRSLYNGEIFNFTPEQSMEYQMRIGGDIMMTFDECTYYSATHEYAQSAMERTHEWLRRCIQYKAQHKPASQVAKNLVLPPIIKQFLYGIIQGGGHEDLRKKSAEFVISQDTDGVAIGGVAIEGASLGETKEKVRQQVEWVAPYLPSDRPVHLLGIGQIDDIVDFVEYGIDTFDCAEPTRVARNGRIYNLQQILSRISLLPNPSMRNQREYETDILKTIYKSDLSPVDEGCTCWVCNKFTKAYLHHLFKQKEILGYILATYHNLSVMERFFSLVREMIGENRL